MMDFEQNDVVVVGCALRDGKCEVAMGDVSQVVINERRKRLHAAALAQVEPIEILTLPDGSGGVKFLVRRFNV